LYIFIQKQFYILSIAQNKSKKTYKAAFFVALAQHKPKTTPIAAPFVVAAQHRLKITHIVAQLLPQATFCNHITANYLSNRLSLPSDLL